MRTLPHENEMSSLLAPDSVSFNLFLEYLIGQQNEIRSMMPLSKDGQSFEKLQQQWLFLETLTKDEGNELRLRMRKFWHENAPKKRLPFDE